MNLTTVIILVVLLLFTVILKKLGVISFEVENFRKLVIKFSTDRPSGIKVSPLTTLDAVISSDGLIYKFQLLVSILFSNNSHPTNWWLDTKGLSKMVFKQYFYIDPTGNRVGLSNAYQLPQRTEESHIVGLEFEPEKGWDPIKLGEKVYECVLRWDGLSGKSKVGFAFRVRAQNVSAIQSESILAKRRRQARIVSFPRIK